MTFKRVVANSGLTKTELAELYGVSRQTVHTWAGSKRKPPSPPRAGSYTERMATVITLALENAIDRKILPMGPMAKDVRRARVTRMSKTLQNLKPAPGKT